MIRFTNTRTRPAHRHAASNSDQADPTEHDVADADDASELSLHSSNQYQYQDADVTEEQDEAKVEEELRAELERLRMETASALKKSWAEVEALQNEGMEGKDKVRELERELQTMRTRQRQRQWQSVGSESSAPSVSDEEDSYYDSSDASDYDDDAGGGVLYMPGSESVKGGKLVESFGLGNDTYRYGNNHQDATLYIQSSPYHRDQILDSNTDEDERADESRSPRRDCRRRLSTGDMGVPFEHRSEAVESDSGVMFGRRLSSMMPEHKNEGKDEKEQQQIQEQELHRSQPDHGLSSNDDGIIGKTIKKNEYDDRPCHMSAPLNDVKTLFRDNDFTDSKSVEESQTDFKRGNKRTKRRRRISSSGSLAEASLAAVSNILQLEGGEKATSDGEEFLSIHDPRRKRSAVELGLLDQLTGLINEKQRMIDEMEGKLREQEAEIEAMERSTNRQAQTISKLQAEFDGLRRQIDEEERNSAVPDMESVRDEVQRNWNQAMALERQLRDAQYKLECRMEREHALVAELAMNEAHSKAIEEGALSQLTVLEEQLRHTRESRSKYEEENRASKHEMEDKMNKMRSDLYGVLAEGGHISDSFVILMDTFQAVRQKEKELLEVLVSRMPEKKEAFNTMEVIEESRGRADTARDAALELIQKFTSSLASIELDDNTFYRRDGGDEKIRSIKQHHNGGIAVLESLAAVQAEACTSLGEVEKELMKRVAFLDWNASQVNGIKRSSLSLSPKARVKAARRVNSEAIKIAERTQKETRGRLDAIRDDIKNKISNPIGVEESVHSTTTATESSDEEGAVKKIIEEMLAEDAEVELLQAKSAQLEEQISSLQHELEELKTWRLEAIVH